MPRHLTRRSLEHGYKVLINTSANCTRFPAAGWSASVSSFAPAAAAAGADSYGTQRRGQALWPAATLAAAAAACALWPTTAAADASAAPAGAATHADADGVAPSHTKLLSLGVRRRIFFKYEKRIREMSSLEKIFEYFATQTRDGVKQMNAGDLVRSLVPTYPPHDSNIERAGFLDGESGLPSSTEAKESIFQHIDANADGLVSFSEFTLVVLLLSIPEEDVAVVFDVIDIDSSGSIDADEFGMVLALLERRAGLQCKFHGRVGSEDLAFTPPAGLLHTFFGEQQSGKLRLPRFRAFLQQLHSDLVRLEFQHYHTGGDAAISGIDFGISLVAAAHVKVVDSLLDKAEQMPPALAKTAISVADFESVATLRRNLHRLSYALNFLLQLNRPLSKSDFDKLVRRLMGLHLSSRVLDVLFYMFEDGSGHLNVPLFIDVMKRRSRVPGTKLAQSLQASAEEGGIASQFTRFFSCVSDCSSNS